MSKSSPFRALVLRLSTLLSASSVKKDADIAAKNGYSVVNNVSVKK